MKIYFCLLSLEKTMFSFTLKDYKTIENIEILIPVLAREVMFCKELTTEHFLTMLRFYMGGEFSIKEYIEHIKKYGFYSPYQPNLRVFIEEI